MRVSVDECELQELRAIHHSQGKRVCKIQQINSNIVIQYSCKKSLPSRRLISKNQDWTILSKIYRQGKDAHSRISYPASRWRAEKGLAPPPPLPLPPESPPRGSSDLGGSRAAGLRFPPLRCWCWLSQTAQVCDYPACRTRSNYREMSLSTSGFGSLVPHPRDNSCRAVSQRLVRPLL